MKSCILVGHIGTPFGEPVESGPKTILHEVIAFMLNYFSFELLLIAYIVKQLG